MKNEFENSDKRLQEKLEGFRMAAPEGAWAGIEGNIGGKAGGRSKFFYFLMVFLFIGVTGAGVLTFLYLNNDQDENAAPSSIIASRENLDKNQHNTKTNEQKNNPSKTSDNSENTLERITNESNAPVNAQNEQNNRSTTSSRMNNQHATSSVQQQSSTNNSNSSASNASNTTNTSTSNNTTSNSASNNSSTNSNSNQSENNTASNNTSSSENNTNSETTSLNSESSTQSNGGENNAVAENTTSEKENKSSDASNNTTALNSDDKDSTTLTSIPTSEEPDILNIEKLAPKHGPEVKVKPSWSIEGGLDVSSVNLNHSAANNSGLQQSLNASYSQNFAQAAFLRVNYKPFQRFSFHSGLEYAQNKATQDYSWITTTSTWELDTTGFYFDTVTQQQLPIVDSVETISSVENQVQYKSVFNQLYIPLGAMFHVPLGNRSELGINVTGLVGIRTGSTGNILLDENGNTIATAEAYRQVNFSARTALRYSYIFGAKSAMYIEPYVGFGLNDRSNTTLPFGTRFRNSGIRVGFRYNF